MSYVFEMLFLFLLVAIFLLSSLDEIYVRVKVLADHVWEAEDDQTCFLNVVVDSFDQLFLKNDLCPWPWCKIAINTEDMINEDKWKKSTNRKSEKPILMNVQFFLWDPPMKNIIKSKNVRNKFWWMFNCFGETPFYSSNITF